jgi:hypothetical protein
MASEHDHPASGLDLGYVGSDVAEVEAGFSKVAG